MARPCRPRVAVEGNLAPTPEVVPTGEDDRIVVLEKMKPLIALCGAEKVKKRVDLLGCAPRNRPRGNRSWLRS